MPILTLSNAGSIHYHIPLCALMSLVSVAAFVRPCVSLEWSFGAIRWSWLSCIGAWRAGQHIPVSLCSYHKVSVCPQNAISDNYVFPTDYIFC